MKILLAVDGSAFTKHMLGYLATHEALYGPQNQFTLLTVQRPLPARVRSALSKEVVDDYMHSEAEKILAPISKFLLRHGISAKSIVKPGMAGEVIARTAEGGKFDMVIMGSHGHSSMGNLVMGSVATQVLAHCKVPVLLVR